MTKILKYTVITIVAFFVLLLIAVAIIVATFNPNQYKPQLIKLVQEKKQRTLAIPGDIKLSFFPKLGFDLGKVSISERNEPAEFASVDSAKLSLALIPLLSKRYVVDHVQMEGLRANIRKQKNGNTNFDDFTSQDKEEKEQGQAVKFDIDGIDVKNAHIVYDDQQASRKMELAKLNLETGKIANGVASKMKLSSLVRINNPNVNAMVAIKTGFTMDLDHHHYVFKGLDSEVKGNLLGFADSLFKLAGDGDINLDSKQFALNDIAFSVKGEKGVQNIDAKLNLPKLSITDKQVTGGKLQGDAVITEGARKITASFSMPSFDGSPQAFALPSLSIDAAIKEDKLDAQAKIRGAIAGDIDKRIFTSPKISLDLSGKQGDTALKGSLVTPLSVNLKTQLIDLPAIVASFVLPNPGGGTVALKSNGTANLNLAKHSATANLKGTLDESAFDAKLSLPNFSPATYAFDISIDRIDVDRYKSKQAAASSPSAAKSSATTPAAEKPMDISALKTLNANGSIKVGALKAANIKASNVRLDLHAADGKIDMRPLNANLYGGSVAGSLSVVASNPARFTIQQKLTNVQVGPLLKDVLQKEPLLEGQGNVQLDVNTSGGTLPQIKKGLNGTARLELRDGAVRGVNIAQVVRNAKAKIGALRGSGGDSGNAQQTGTGSSGEKTDFSEMTASLHINNGVAHNDDLSIKSPLFRIGGAGDVNIGEDRLNYLVKATVVSNLQGQGGPELQTLKGLTVPVRLSGPYTALAWHIDFGGLASDLAKQKLNDKKEELKTKAEDQLKNSLKGLFGR